MSRPRTLYEKIWDDHVVERRPDGTSLLYIDRHIIHEVTTPQAFEGLRAAGRRVRRPDLVLAVPDHNVPTTRRVENGQLLPIADPQSATQVATLKANCAEFGIEHIEMTAAEQGIVHVVGPEQGFTLPGTTVVCGDSHTSTHGAFGALAFGIGTSEVEHVLATQTLLLKQSRPMEVRVEGQLGFSITPKDVALAISGELGAAGGTGYVLEYTGSAMRDMSIEGRMTVCNMSIEAGARAGMIAPDEKTFEYLRGREYAPKGSAFDKAVEEWKKLRTDEGAKFDKVVEFDASTLIPQVTWGTSPGMGADIESVVPDPDDFPTENERKAAKRALEYMGLKPGMKLEGLKIDRVFIGSCTNGRIEDLRQAAAVVKGYKVAPHVHAMVVPGSGRVKKQAEKEGLDKIFIEAGFEWRDAGCSMCLAMNPDVLQPGERCASTSNRNFEGRQGRGGRTHLVSPAMAAAAAIKGHFTDVRKWEFR